VHPEYLLLLLLSAVLYAIWGSQSEVLFDQGDWIANNTLGVSVSSYFRSLAGMGGDDLILQPHRGTNTNTSCC
jgi:hypothetical protein